MVSITCRKIHQLAYLPDTEHSPQRLKVMNNRQRAVDIPPKRPHNISSMHPTTPAVYPMITGTQSLPA